MMALGERLWEPSRERIERTNMWRFLQFVNERHRLLLSNYSELYQWSVDNIPEFWADLWDFLSVIHSKPYEVVVDDLGKMPGARWFIGAELNFAQNLLR